MVVKKVSKAPKKVSRSPKKAVSSISPKKAVSSSISPKKAVSSPKKTGKLNELLEYVKENKVLTAYRGAVALGGAAYLNDLRKYPSVENQLSKIKTFFAKNFSVSKRVLGEIFSESYDVDKKIGSGSFGAIFIAKDKKTGETVIIKQVTLGGPNPGLTDTLLKNEISVLQRLVEVKSKYTTRYITHKYHENSIYIVLSYDYLDTLDTIINQGTTMDIKENIFNNCIKGMKDLHSNGLCHNDIKWQNIIVEAASGNIKYIDFGIACSGSCVIAGGLSGTLETIAPEHISFQILVNNGFQSPRARTLNEGKIGDVWSLGVVLYYLMYNKHPYSADKLDGSTKLKQVYNITTVTSKKTVFDDSIVDKKFNDILRSMLVDKPEDRITISKINVPRNIGSVVAKAKRFFGFF